MTAAELKDMFIDAGMTAEQADAAIKSEKVGQRAAQLAQKKEYDAALASADALKKEADAAKDYKVWYDKNYPAIQQLQATAAKYAERYGSLDAPNPTPSGGGITIDQAKLQELVTKAANEAANHLIQTQYAPLWSSLMLNFSDVFEQHRANGRKEKLDMKKVSELAEKEYGGDLNKAYSEWDRPAAEAAATAKATADKADLDKTIEKRARELAAQYASKGSFQGDPLSSSSAGLTHRAEVKDPAAARTNRLADAISAGTGKPRTDIFSGGSVN